MKPLLFCFYSNKYEILSFCSNQIFSFTKNRKKKKRAVVVLTKIDCLPFDAKAKGMVTVQKELFNKHYAYFMKIIN